jgi:hypothetical protein
VLCGSLPAVLLALGVLRQLVAAFVFARGALRHFSGSSLALRALRQLSGNFSRSWCFATASGGISFGSCCFAAALRQFLALGSWCFAAPLAASLLSRGVLRQLSGSSLALGSRCVAAALWKFF